MNIKEKSSNHGITLIALVITIIVMLILVAVTISMAVNGGLFGKAADAGRQTNEAVKAEQELGSGKVKIKDGSTIYEYDNINAYFTNTPSKVYEEGEIPEDPEKPGDTEGGGSGEEKEYLGMTNEEKDSGIGCYVKIGNQYGVIYADLAFARPASENHQWYNSSGVYSWEAENHTQLKKYYKDGRYDPDGPNVGWGEMDLLVADDELNQTEGRTKDRFYVMALENVGGSSTTYCWYADAYGNMSDYETATSGDFGKGQENTTKMIAKWDKGSGEGGYGAQDTGDYKDMWGQIKTQVANGWFVPSRAEWSAFAEELKITSQTYPNYGLNYYYWSSSQDTASRAWYAGCSRGYMLSYVVDCSYYVRLSTTF